MQEQKFCFAALTLTYFLLLKGHNTSVGPKTIVTSFTYLVTLSYKGLIHIVAQHHLVVLFIVDRTHMC